MADIDLDDAERYLKRLERRSRHQTTAKSVKTKVKSEPKKRKKPERDSGGRRKLSAKENRLLQRNIEKHRRADEECQAILDILQKLAEDHG